jgi:outer membrane lipoprotein-sorting protein
MVCSRLSRATLSLALVPVLLAGSTEARPAVRSPQELLARSDVGSFGPTSFRARLLLTPPPPRESREIEVWRSGEAKTLVRFLSPKERGKYLLRLGGQLWLVAPGAREPVRISASYRLYGGATLDEVLGTRLAREYALESASEEEEAGGTVVVLELRAKAEHVLFPEVRYVVREATERPIRAEYRLRSGRPATSVEFGEWNEKGPRYARRLLVRDLLRKGALTEVRVLEMQERSVPESLFDLRDSSARRTLDAGMAVPP